jgi:hypothetical protein
MEPENPDGHSAGGRTALLVLGMHRSGTSVLTELIARLGAAPPEDPNPPAPDNPRGYWEPAGLVGLHDQMLREADSAWLDTRPLDLSTIGPERWASFAVRLEAALDRSFGTARLFVLKDPRICRMVPLYRELLAGRGIRLKVVLALRAPADVAASLFARNQISPDYAGLLWARHLLEAERETRDLPRMVVSYEGLMEDRRTVAARLAAFIGTREEAGILADTDAIVEAGLHHHRATSDAAFSAPLGAFLRDVDGALRSRVGADALDHAARFDRASERLSRISALFADILTVEFCFQRLTSPYDTVTAPDPLRERESLAGALGRLQRAGWREPMDGPAPDEAPAR